MPLIMEFTVTGQSIFVDHKVKTTEKHHIGKVEYVSQSLVFETCSFLFSGLKFATQKFPTGLITGTAPASCRPPPPPQIGKKKPKERPPEPIRPADQTDFTDDDILYIFQSDW